MEDPNDVPAAFRKKYKDQVGRKSVSADEISERVSAVPFRQRGSLRSLEAASGLSKSSLRRSIKRGQIHRHSNTVKPYLTDQNKRDRVKFALSFVRSHVTSLLFGTMFDYVHLDEKWFYLTRIKQNYYMVQGKKSPARKVKSKCYIMKVMFLCVVARPRYDDHRKAYLDGKIGLWPFVERVPAKRNSRNRPAGTLETKPITVTQDDYRSFLLKKVFPAIINKWPAYKHHPVYIQQDNARPHIPSHDQEIR